MKFQNVGVVKFAWLSHTRFAWILALFQSGSDLRERLRAIGV